MDLHQFSRSARTKVGNDWRVPLHLRLAGILRALPMPKDGFLFTAPPSTKYPDGGHWINTKHLNDDFVKTVIKLGMPAGRDHGFTIHSLRHFFKSFCVTHGVPREYVDDWQGHKSIKSASDLYVHTFEDESRRLMNSVPFGDGKTAADTVN
jgi:integrase